MKLFKAFVATISLSLAPAPATADLSSTLGEMLDFAIHVNSPGAISTQKRGAFYGGSVYIRGRVVDTNIVNFTPPSFSSGCGGVDLFAGSFSMIDSAQFVALLRAVAQNAAAYAFQLALKNICEQCATIVAGLQKAIQAMNEFTGNSCQLAQGIVNDTINAFEMSDVKGMSSASVQQGWEDAWSAFNEGLQQTITALDTPTGGATTSLYEDRYETNVTWAALRISLGSTLQLPSMANIRQASMTMLGTIIIKGPFDDRDTNPSRNISRIAGGRITVKELVYGNPDAMLLACDEGTKCLNPTRANVPIKGVHQHLEETYIGTGPTDTTSVLWDLMHGTTAEIDVAKERLVVDLGNIGGILVSIAERSPPGSTYVYEMFQKYSEYIAVELTSLFLSQTIVAIDQELKQEYYDVSYAEDWLRNDYAQTKVELGRQISDLYTSVPQPPIREFIEVFNYMTSVNPFME